MGHPGQEIDLGTAGQIISLPVNICLDNLHNFLELRAFFHAPVTVFRLADKADCSHQLAAVIHWNTKARRLKRNMKNTAFLRCKYGIFFEFHISGDKMPGTPFHSSGLKMVNRRVLFSVLLLMPLLIYSGSIEIPPDVCHQNIRNPVCTPKLCKQNRNNRSHLPASVKKIKHSGYHIQSADISITCNLIIIPFFDTFRLRHILAEG